MTWYRYYDILDHAGNPLICLQKFDVVRETPKGVWLVPPGVHGKQFWVSKTARKRRAYPSRIEAWNSFLHRKDWQERRLLQQLERVQNVRHIARRVPSETPPWTTQS